MNRLLAPALLLLAFGCGRKEAPQPEAVIQVLPAEVAEQEQAQEPEPVHKPQTAVQPNAISDTAAADTGAAAPRLERIITDEEFKRLPVYSDGREGRVAIGLGIPTTPRLKPTQGSVRGLSGKEVERAGGIFEAVKTVPGVKGE